MADTTAVIRWLFSALLAFVAIRFLGEAHGHLEMFIAVAEALGAVLLPFRTTRRAGAATLVSVFVVAAIHHAVAGDFAPNVIFLAMLVILLARSGERKAIDV